MHRPLLTATFLLTSAALASAQTVPTTMPSIPPTRESYLRIAAEVEASLQNDDLKKFFPAAVDTSPTGGGFLETFATDWTHVDGSGSPRGGAAAQRDTTRSVVYQSRLTWLAAQAAERYPADADKYLAIVRHGAGFLIEKQWDPAAGGFWWSVDTAGKPQRTDDKHAYGNSFAIYALAAAFHATHDAADLEAAKKAFQWFDSHAHDDAHGGYFEQIRADGSLAAVAATGRNGGTANDVIGTRNGLKSMNTHIHLLEAFTELLRVWPDPQLKKRTEELYQLNLTKIYAAMPGDAGGYLHMFFNPDWAPVEGRDSYGHDIESAFLFADAAAALGKPEDPACWAAGKNIVDHCLRVGFNQSSGFLNGEGTLDGTGPMGGNLEWWVEAESLNALLLMHERYGKENPAYWNAFVKQWAFIQNHFIDPANGGWFKGVSSTTLAPTRGNKTDAWTEGYHQGRSMLNVTERLKKLAEK